MLNKIYLPALLIVQYIGEHPIGLHGIRYYRGEEAPKLKKGDYFICDTATASIFNQKRGYKSLSKKESEALLLREQEPIALSDAELLTLCQEREIWQYAPTEGKAEEDPEVETEAKEDPIPTVEQLPALDEKKIKNLCKKFGIKIGRKKVEDLIPLLIPYIQQQQD